MYNDSLLLASGLHLYPELHNPPPDGWLEKLETRLSGAIGRTVRAHKWYLHRLLASVNQQAAHYDKLTLTELREGARELRKELRGQGFRDDLIARAFALVRATAHLTLGMRHFDSQVLGGLVMLKGMVAEMSTGEGKTLTATLTACTAAIAGVPVHVITVNDYLAQRDAENMMPIYAALGVTVGIVQSEMTPEQRQQSYRCDVTYCTNKDVVFDYLRDRILLRNESSPLFLQMRKLYGSDERFGKLLLRGLHFAIVDEADSVLVDEARTPLVISATTEGNEEIKVLRQAIELGGRMVLNEDFKIVENGTRVELTRECKDCLQEDVEELGGLWSGKLFREEMLTQALTALHLFHRDEHYLVRDDKVQIIDEHTGRVMADRSWEKGLHQLIELKEDCEVTGGRESLARISYQRFFRRYLHLSGMTGTAREVAGELAYVYDLPVVRIPTHKPEQRRNLPGRYFHSEAQKWQKIGQRVQELNQKGCPVMLGTRSVAASELASNTLSALGLEHRVLNAKQDLEEAEIVSQAGNLGTITVATSMAGRGTDIKISPEVESIGGLHVILSERYDSKRNDRQLAGRCARQGDPGCFETFGSLDDALMRSSWFSNHPWLLQVVRFLIGARFLPLRWIAPLMLRMAQRRVEKMHSRIRKELLEIDDRMSQNLAFSGEGE